ncbi:hypothetical protein AGMMS49953_03190 [Endomicrobiia bacterium]|nr:hypothetical protein AGMMS49953_03190 [Endomicrobiia bacterium]
MKEGMCRSFKYTIYVLVVLVVLVSLYYARAFIFVPFIQKYISDKTGYEVKFDNFYILPFSITFANVDMDNMIAIQKITFKLSPVKFFVHITAPLNCISQINISKLEISLNENHKDKNVSSDKRSVDLELPKSEIAIFVDEAVVKNDNSRLLKIIDADILINHDKITLESVICALGIPVKVSSRIDRAKGNIFNTSSAFTAKNKIDMLLKSTGTIDLSSLSITQNITVEKLIYSGFKLIAPSGSFSKIRDAYKINLVGGFGKFEFNSFSGSATEAKPEIDISKTNKSMSGDISLNFKEQYSISVFGLNVTDLVGFGFKLGNFNLSGTKNRGGIYSMLCTYGRGGKIEIDYTKGGDYEAKLIIKNKTAGTVRGNMKTGEVTADMKNIDVAYIPFIEKSAKGIINILGAMDEISGHIDFSIRNFTASGIESADMKGSITKNNNMYVFNFYKSDNSITLSNIIKSGEIISTDFKFVNVDVLNILRICGYSKYDVSGIASGRIKYERGSVTEFDIKVFDVTIYGNKFKKFEAKGDINLNRINIERFVLKNYSDEITADIKGLLGFTETNPVSSLYVNLKDINVGRIKVSGYAAFQGSLSGNNEIKGVIESTGASISGVSLGNILADVTISTKKLEISNLKSGNNIEASAIADFKENKISGSLYFKNTNIKGIYAGVSGFLSSTVKFSGRLDNPDVKILAFIKRGKYLSKPFSFSSELEYKNNSIKVNRAALSADKMKVALKGNYLNGGVLSLSVENLTENIINVFVGFKTFVKGIFSGSGLFTVKEGKQYLKMFLEAKSAYIKTVKLNDVKCDVEISGGNIVVGGVSAKIFDSEIKMGKGFFNIESGKYGLDLLLINAHAGPVNLLGNIELSGKMTKRKGGSIYSGTIDLRDFWLNRHKLPFSCFDYTVKDGTLELLQKANVVNLYSSLGLIVFGNVISVKEFNISKDKTSLGLRADFSKDSVNLGIKGSNIDWCFINDVLNLPGILRGNADIDVSLSGNISRPEGNISITSINGSIMEVPYDNFNVEANFSDNYARIKKATVFNRNGVSISARGDFPLWFDKTLSEKMRKKPINVVYEIEDHKLNILKYFSKDYINPRSGEMLLKGAFEGTYEKIKNNGRLLIKGGSFRAKDYIAEGKDMSVEMSIIENLIRIDKFNFKSGSGKLNIYGQLKLDNFNIKDFDIRFVTDDKGIFLRVPQLPIVQGVVGSKLFLQDCSAGDLSFDVRVQGPPAKPKVSGLISLENTRFTFPGISDEYKDIDFFIPENTEFNLKLITAKNTRFENSFVCALINGFLYIEGPYNNLKMNGIIETSSGRVDYLGFEFNILNAKVEIIDAVDENKVYIAAEGETTIFSKTGDKSETIKLTIDRFEIPKISQGSVGFYLKDSLNEAIEKVTKVELDAKVDKNVLGFSMKQWILHLVDQSLTTPFAKMILRKTGFIDNFRVSYVQTDADVCGTEDRAFTNLFSGKKYSVEKNLTNQILLGYSVTFDKFDRKLDIRHEIEAIYKLMNNLRLVGSYELKSLERFHRSDIRLMLQYQIRF